MPLISIVVPAHNAERFLAATLDSVLVQSHEEWECVVVDDDSADATLAVAEQYASMDKRIRAIHVVGGGVSAARNAGFRVSSERAEYCTFMDSDDVWVPTALEVLLERARRDSEAIGAHGVAEFIDESGDLLRPGEFSGRGLRRYGLVGRRREEIPRDAPTDFSVLVLGPVVFPPDLVLVERSAYLSAGPFDESLIAGEDWDMLVRVSRFGHLAFLPEIIAFYRRHDDNLGAKALAPRQVHLAQCQIVHSPLNTAEQRRMARLGWRALQRERIEETLAEVRARGIHSPGATAAQLARCGVVAARYVRGYPTPVICREALSW